jgi:hypothetical protein
MRLLPVSKLALLAIVCDYFCHGKAIHAPPIKPSAGPDKDMDCAIRALAFEYSKYLLAAFPLHARRNSSASIYKSLGLKACGSPFTFTLGDQGADQTNDARPNKGPVANTTFFVSPESGDDANSGTENAPFASLLRAQAAARHTDGPATVFLTPGRHELNKTMELTEADGGTTYSSVPGGDVVLSGGKKLTLQWKPSTGGGGVLEAKVPAGLKFTSLFIDSERQVRARFPNGNPENTLFPDGYQQAGSSWGANRKWKEKLKKTTLKEPNRESAESFGHYCYSTGGSAELFAVPEWADGVGSFQFDDRDGDYTHVQHGSLKWRNKRLENWKTDPSSIVIHAMQDNFWSNYMWQVWHQLMCDNCSSSLTDVGCCCWV